ncbi:MAG: dihydrolipoamide acetyltransferase [Acidobacteria bacterium]|nr:MAG: dihydrolipoamide acetyltransferase [Acidobacteriota bacterium]
MATSIVMPALEMAQETGKIVSWLKKEGDTVSKGEILLEVETDKAVVEVEATADGVLAGVKSREGDVVPVGQTIAWLVSPGEQPPADLTAATPTARSTVGAVREAQARQRHSAQPQENTAPTELGSNSPQISPKARRLAKEKGVDITKIVGRGPDGVITSEDVLKAAEAPSAPTPVAAPSTLSAVARLMAERTTQSWTQVPHFFLVRDVDAGALIDLRETLGSKTVTHTDLLVALVARVLTKHPKLNATWDSGAIRLNSSINISVAMAVQDGVVGAVIPNADKTGITEIASQRKELTDRARNGRLRPGDVAGGTFTITNLGMYNVDAFNAIIAPPQAAILAVGRIADRVIALNGQPAVRPMMTLTLSADHRVVDGAQAALFLNDLADALRTPGQWINGSNSRSG